MIQDMHNECISLEWYWTKIRLYSCTYLDAWITSSRRGHGCQLLSVIDGSHDLLTFWRSLLPCDFCSAWALPRQGWRAGDRTTATAWSGGAATGPCVRGSRWAPDRTGWVGMNGEKLWHLGLIYLVHPITNGCDIVGYLILRSQVL